ncbi:Sirohydrochlorin cobaltochelatase protein [Marine Group I thaumarchaeote SCGC AAA799-D11]|uniref:Sirohydrochlorin cobaltochelatase protein n=1 Tax=Marine Group I thaumarchaeote SCGC AAA799-D11 TaxID=1502291 RepID=A0A087RLY6_9ARCH|nr:Sirohydrochlorin cobaltochelatase protein [Marine Group I thaumarchaeote SCGC AAA799-D11]
MKRGLLIIDRGSREREASEELETICTGIKAKGDYVFTDYCFLDFLYPGKKVKIAVTDTMKLQKDTEVKFLITKPMSMHKTLVDIVENRIATTLKENNVTWPNKDVDVMIIGHGSKDPNAQMSLNYIVDELKDSYRNVSRCWLEIEQPDIFEGIKKCEKDEPKVLIIVFYFLHEGAHVKTDINNDLIPALKDSSLKDVFITKHIGTDEKIIDLIIERAKEVEDAN